MPAVYIVDKSACGADEEPWDDPAMGAAKEGGLMGAYG